jgi:hypothetical protein
MREGIGERTSEKKGGGWKRIGEKNQGGERWTEDTFFPEN